MSVSAACQVAAIRPIGLQLLPTGAHHAPTRRLVTRQPNMVDTDMSSGSSHFKTKTNSLVLASGIFAAYVNMVGWHTLVYASFVSCNHHVACCMCLLQTSTDNTAKTS